jgi:hypothetical protein
MGKPALPDSPSGRLGRYFKYAIGEILLVMVGILLALWINNLNIENQQSKERAVLIKNIKQELEENLSLFERRTKRLNEINHQLIKVLNFSATSASDEPIDSLKNFVLKALTFEAAGFNNSRLSSAKSSGKISLLTDDLITSLTIYETSTINYRAFIEETNLTFNEDWSSIIIKFSAMEDFHNLFYGNQPLKKHPELVLNDKDLLHYLKKPEHYKFLHKYYTKYMVENLWLEELKLRIQSTLELMKKLDND